MQLFSGTLSLPPKILDEFNRIAENTKSHFLNLPRSKIKVPNIEALKARAWARDWVVLARGPSFFKHDYVEKLKQAREMGHQFEIVSADGAAAHCLEKDLLPSVVCTCDPSVRILRWFGDVRGANDEDEYFVKDRDAPKNGKALLSKEKTISLFDRYGEDLTVILNPLTHEYVVDRLMSIRADLYQYVPLSDDTNFMDTLWSEYPNLTALSTGGNVGTLSFNLARYLGAKRIALCGMDFSYPPGTELSQTQYFDLIQKNPRLAEEMFFKVSNPNLPEAWFTDIIYLLYAHVFVQMAQDAKKNGVHVVNATEGGILSDESIEWGTLTQFLMGTPNGV